jgi:hypothetical protein
VLKNVSIICPVHQYNICKLNFPKNSTLEMLIRNIAFLSAMFIDGSNF